MPQCPACNAPLKDDYGMQACPKCKAFVFVDMDGAASVGPDPATLAPEPEPVKSVESMVTAAPAAYEPATPQEISSFTSEAPLPVEPSPIDFGQSQDSHNQLPQDFAPMSGDESSEQNYNEPPTPQDPIETSAPAASPSAPDGYEPIDTYPNHNQGDEPGPPGDPLGISQYARSESSQAKDGVLLFRLFISGIDTKELRDSIRSAIEDARFAWDAAAVAARIEKGRLMIDNLSPVKTTILVNRIKSLPVKIRWEQYAITQTDGSS